MDLPQFAEALSQALGLQHDLAQGGHFDKEAAAEDGDTESTSLATARITAALAATGETTRVDPAMPEPTSGDAASAGPGHPASHASVSAGWRRVAGEVVQAEFRRLKHGEALSREDFVLYWVTTLQPIGVLHGASAFPRGIASLWESPSILQIFLLSARESVSGQPVVSLRDGEVLGERGATGSCVSASLKPDLLLATPPQSSASSALPAFWASVATGAPPTRRTSCPWRLCGRSTRPSPGASTGARPIPGEWGWAREGNNT